MATRAPATGTVQWLKPALNGNRVLEIAVSGKAQQYEVERHPEGGFRLHRVDYRTGEFFCYRVTAVSAKTWTCACPDAKRRPGRENCKHSRGLRKALQSLPF